MEGDEEGKRWLRRFLEAHELTWPQVPTHPWWYAEPFEAYNVHYIPFNLLIDREGRVVETDLRGRALDRKLAALLEPPANRPAP